MGLFSLEKKVFDGFNTAYQCHYNLKDKVKEIQQNFTNRKEAIYDPQKYINNFSIENVGFKSKSSENLKNLDHPKGISKFHNFKINDKYTFNQTKSIDEINFEKINNIYSNIM
jgi:hypothetical protein